MKAAGREKENENTAAAFLYCKNGGKVIKCKHSFAVFFTKWEIIGEEYYGYVYR